jgi:hypothetical protein
MMKRNRGAEDRWINWAILALLIIIVLLLWSPLVKAGDYQEGSWKEPYATFSEFTKFHNIEASWRVPKIGRILLAVEKPCADEAWSYDTKGCRPTYWLLYKHFSMAYIGLAVQPLTVEQVDALDSDEIMFTERGKDEHSGTSS